SEATAAKSSRGPWIAMVGSASRSRSLVPRFSRPILLASFLALALVAALRGAGDAGATAYPVQASANGRYLIDQNQTPYLIVGDAPQALTVNLSEAEAESYFANRAAHGF